MSLRVFFALSVILLFFASFTYTGVVAYHHINFWIAFSLTLLGGLALLPPAAHYYWRTMPLLIAFGVFFVGVYIKFVYFFYITNSEDSLVFGKVATSVSSIVLQAFELENLLKALMVASVGFLAFGSAAMMTHFSGFLPRAMPIPARPSRGAERRFVQMSSAVALAIFSITTYFGLKYGVGFMGKEEVELPFKLTGLINYGRTFPQWILLLVAAIGLIVRSRYMAVWGLVLLSVYSVAISFVAGGRGTFTLVIILVAPIMIAYQLVSRKLILTAFLLIAAATMMRPVFEAYRQLVTDTSESTTRSEGFLTALQNRGSGEGTILAVIEERLTSIIFRVSGLDSLVFFTLYTPPPFSPTTIVNVFTGDIRVERILTDEYMLNSSEAGRAHSAAPTMVGTMYYAGGIPFVYLGIFCFVCLCQYIYYRVSQYIIWTAPIILSKLASQVLATLSEGIFTKIVLELLVFVAMAFCLERFCRLILGAPKLPRLPSP